MENKSLKNEIIKTMIKAHKVGLEHYGYIFDDEYTTLIDATMLGFLLDDFSISTSISHKGWKVEEDYNTTEFFNAFDSLIEDSAKFTALVNSPLPLLLVKYREDDDKINLLLANYTKESGVLVISFIDLPEEFIKVVNENNLGGELKEYI